MTLPVIDGEFTEIPKNPIDGLVADALEKKEESELTENQKVFKTFQDSLNEFIIKIGRFEGSKSQLQRVMVNLAISPLNGEELHHGYAEEKELFDLGSTVNSTKFFLMLAGLEEQGKITVLDTEEAAVSASEQLSEDNSNG